MRPLCSTIAVVLLLGCDAKEPQRANELDVVLQRELIERLAKDQTVRDTFAARLQRGEAPDARLIASMMATDSANTRWLRDLIDRDGWPTRKRVGAEGVNAAFLLVQHADHDTAFQALVLPQVEQAFRAGEVAGQEVALLTDRVAVARGQPQEYGTQADFKDRRVVFKPIRDSAQVDARRARMGLPSLAAYVRVLDSVYFGRTP